MGGKEQEGKGWRVRIGGKGVGGKSYAGKR